MVLSRMSHLGHGVWEYGNTVIAFSGLTGGTGTGVRVRGYGDGETGQDPDTNSMSRSVGMSRKVEKCLVWTSFH